MILIVILTTVLHCGLKYRKTFFSSNDVTVTIVLMRSDVSRDFVFFFLLAGTSWRLIFLHLIFKDGSLDDPIMFVYIRIDMFFSESKKKVLISECVCVCT
jgi:hypothetical protein